MEDLFPLESSWIVAAIAGVIAIVMLIRLYRALPLQNILLITAALMIGQGLLEFLVVKVGKIDVPDPQWHYRLGAASLWLAVTLTARRVTKFIARPWRHEKVHWIWVIGLSSVGTAAFQFGWTLLDPDFPFPAKAFGMAGVRLLGTAVMLACLSPWFIRKKAIPGKDFSELPDDPKDETEQQAQEKTSS
jgi:hypothetical protein